MTFIIYLFFIITSIILFNILLKRKNFLISVTGDNHQKFASRLHEKQIFKVCHYSRKPAINGKIDQKAMLKTNAILTSILDRFWTPKSLQNRWKIDFVASGGVRALPGGLGVPPRLEKCPKNHLLYHLGDVSLNEKLYMFIVGPLF